jgi:hypothetical protein
MVIHLTLTGPNAGTAGCMVNYNGGSWGCDPLPDGDRGAHYAYATPEMIDGTYVAEDGATMCQDCVTAYKEAE